MKRPRVFEENRHIWTMCKTSMKRPKEKPLKIVIFRMFCHLLVAFVFAKNLKKT